jgi:hypothetical protein
MSSNMNSIETKQKKRTFDEIKTQFIDNEEKELIIKKLKVSEELEIKELDQKFDSIEDSIQLNFNQIIDEFEDKKTIDKQIDKQIDEQRVPQINDCSKVSSNSSQSSNERSNSSQNSIRVEDIPECVQNYRIVPNIEQNEE